MIFNDVVEWYDEILSNYRAIDELRMQLTNALKAYEEASICIIEPNYDRSISNTNYDNYRNQLANRLGSVTDGLQKINFLKVGKCLLRLESLKNENEFISKPLDQLIKCVEYNSNLIHTYLNTPYESKFKYLIGVIQSLNMTITSIDNVKSIGDYLRDINLAIQSDNEYSESAIEIRLYREELNVKEISIYMDTVNSIYERACTLFNVSTSDYELKPIKMESGSWYEKVFGHPSVIKFIEELLDKAIRFIYRNYTREGKLSENKNRIEALKEGIELMELCKKHDINTEVAKEVIEENLNVLCLDVYKLTTGNSKIAINGKIHDIGKEISKSLLEEKSKKYLETAIE